MKARLSEVPGLLAAWSFRSVVVATLGIGLCWTLAYVWTDAARWYPRTPWLHTASSLALVVAAFASAAWIARRPRPFHPATFVAVTVVAGIALRIGYLMVVEPVWAGDFLKYWRNAVDLAGADGYAVTGIYEQRALLYVPLIELFGERPAFLAGFNVALLALAQLAGYDTLRRLHSHQAAQAFTLVWLAVMETTASAAIPSHDLSGTALLAIAFWLNVAGTQRPSGDRRRAAWFVVSTLVLAAVLCLLELLRSLGVLLCLALAIGAIVGLVVAVSGDDDRSGDDGAPRIRSVMVAVLAQACIAFALMSVGMATLARNGLVAPADTVTVLRVTTPQLNAMSEGTYAWMRGFHDTFNRGLMRDPERFREMRASLALSDYIERPVDFAANTFERSGRLWSLGSQYRHYLRGWMAEHKAAARWLATYNLHYAGLFAIFFLVALAAQLTRRGPAHAYFQLILLSGLSLAFVTVLENQPRYIYPVWYTGCLAIGLHLAGAFGRRTAPGIATDLVKLLLQAALFVAAALGLAWAAASLAYTDDDGKVLSDWSLDSSQDLPDAREDRFFAALASRPSDVVPTRRDGHFPAVFGPLSLQLEFPSTPRAGDSVSASRRLCVSGAGRAFSFQYYSPVHPGQDGAFTLELRKDGHPLWTQPLPGAMAPEAVRLPLPPDADGCMRLDFRLVARVDGVGESSRRASRTEIFFPRVEPAASGQ